MADDKNIQSYSAADIEKYHKGLLSPKEMNALEKAALDDPFLAEAMEGYSAPGLNIDADLEDLRKRLAEKSESAKVVPLNKTGGFRRYPWLRVAVMLALIAGAGWISYLFLFNDPGQKTPVARTEDTQGKQGDSVYKEIASGDIPGPHATLTDSVKVSSEAATSGQSIQTKTDKWEVQRNAAVPPTVTGNRSTAQKTGRQDGSDQQLLAIQNNPASASTGKERQVTTAGVATSPADRKTTPEPDELTKRTMGEIAAKAPAENPKDNAPPQFYNAANAQNENTRAKLNKSTSPAGYNAGYANTYLYRGQVLDANGGPLPFANIMNTRDNVGTYTDAKGNFTLLSADTSMHVQVRVVGFENKSLTLQNNIANNFVVMQEDRSVPERVLDSTKRNFVTRTRNVTFEEPEPVDGWTSYNSYVANNLNIPETIDRKRTDEGNTVEISFEVNKYGEPVRIRIEKSLCDKCDKEVIRLIKEGPKWKRNKGGKRTTIAVPFNDPSR